ncbi:MAG: M23 family metallopeptidase [Flavobacteriales bacterium]
MKKITPESSVWRQLGLCSVAILLFGCASKQINQNIPIVREDQVWIERQRLPQRLTIPVKGVSRDQLRDTWGAARSSGRRHQGIDIFAARGTPICSSTSAVVQRIRDSGIGGKAIWLLGPEGSRHYYAHLDQFAKLRVGQRLRAGDRIGTVGNTGNARGGRPHLHYELHLAGQGAVNPYSYLMR